MTKIYGTGIPESESAAIHVVLPVLRFTNSGGLVFLREDSIKHAASLDRRSGIRTLYIHVVAIGMG